MTDWSIYAYIGFGLFVVVMLVVDLGVFHRRAHEVGLKESLIWCGFWVSLALVFNLVIYVWRGPESALQFLTGYVVEYTLSVDNLFVFLLLFNYFGVPARFQYKVLFWGILGALLMRALFIAAGITLLHRFHWTIYVFGLVLVFTGVKMALGKDKVVNPEKNPVLRLCRRVLAVSSEYGEGGFFVRREGAWLATPLFVVLLCVETTDLVFAVDSIPAILAITTDPFLVYTSNVFAILGLRSLFFALSGMMKLFRYLHYGVSCILVFVGFKMLLSGVWKLPTLTSLGVIVGVLAGSILLSLLRPPPGPGSTDGDDTGMEETDDMTRTQRAGAGARSLAERIGTVWGQSGFDAGVARGGERL